MTSARTIARRAKDLAIEARLAWLRRTNARTDRPIVGDSPVVVSMTTYGQRIADAFYAIECLALGPVRPARFMLWLDEDVDLPTSLRRLQDRGLEILPTENYGPHKKYFPYVMSITKHELPLVTADDDILYPSDLLDGLLVAGQQAPPDEVPCRRAMRIVVSGERLAPFIEWGHATDTRPTILNFASNGGGAYYPAPMLDALRDAGDGFRSCCPRVDDVWLHAVALRNGYRARQIRPAWYRLYTVPSTRATALWTDNIVGGGNDVAIAATYTQEDIAALTYEASAFVR